LPFTDFDKMYWFRAGLGVIGGTTAELLTGCKVILTAPNAGSCVGGHVPDYSTGILVWIGLYLFSYYLLRSTIGKRLEKDQQTKVTTTGVGTFVLLFIFSWVLLFTLGVTYLNL
jgi:hypothetical protein